MSEPIHSRDWFTGSNADERYAAQLREAVAREEGTDQPVPAATELIDQWCSGCGAQMHKDEPLHKRTDPGHSQYLAPAPTAPAGLRDRIERLPTHVTVSGGVEWTWVERDAVLAAIASPSEEPGLDVERLATA